MSVCVCVCVCVSLSVCLNIITPEPVIMGFEYKLYKLLVIDKNISDESGNGYGLIKVKVTT